VEALKAGAFREALQLFEEMTRRDPGLADMLEPEITKCLSEIAWQEKEQQIQEEKEKELARIPLYLRKAKNLLEEGELNEANTIYQTVLKLDPENDDAQQGRNTTDAKRRV
jgi:tetratricopeptide (TPR) repeat protein